MSKFAVMVFEDEKKAYEGLQALQELHAEGSLTVWAKPEVRRRIEQRMTDLRNEFAEREQKLTRATELTRQALQP